MALERFDYVIVGAGSAGCCLAARLTEDPGTKVLLLEAGPKDNSLLVRMPAGVGSLLKQKGPYNWGFDTAPQKHLNNRRLYWPRGKGLGGSSSINGMVYIRGHALDYEQWRQMGLEGWGWADVLPYFKRSETLETGADTHHGGDGPLYVSWGKSKNPLYQAFVDAGVQAGHKATTDFNGPQQEGMGKYQLTIKDGERWSSSFAFLKPALDRPNLTCRTGAHITRIVIEGGRAVGVEYASARGAEAAIVHADAEVLLCGGAVGTPQTLLLSGIGPADALQAKGIKVHADSADVGGNMQDHLDVLVLQECTQPITAYSLNKGLKQMFTGLNYLVRKKGLGREQFLESGGFAKSRPDLDRPDIQMHFVNALLQDHGRTPATGDGFSVHACQLRPESKGSVSLGSADPFDDPVIDPNYLAAEEDRRVLRQSIRMVRDIFAQAAMDPYRGNEFLPGKHVQSDADIDAFIRETAETIYHPVGTARMGTDSRSVVDGDLRVRGVEGLRVIDASVMPTLVGGNTNAPTIMIAEKIADKLRGKPALPRFEAPIAELSSAQAA